MAGISGSNNIKSTITLLKSFLYLSKVVAQPLSDLNNESGGHQKPWPVYSYRAKKLNLVRSSLDNTAGHKSFYWALFS